MANDESTFPEMTGFFQVSNGCHSCAVTHLGNESDWMYSRLHPIRR